MPKVADKFQFGLRIYRSIRPDRSLDCCEWDDGKHSPPSRWAAFPDGTPIAICSACWESVKGGTWQFKPIRDCEISRSEAECLEIFSA
jgi:hypothetical protein